VPSNVLVPLHCSNNNNNNLNKRNRNRGTRTLIEEVGEEDEEVVEEALEERALERINKTNNNRPQGPLKNTLFRVVSGCGRIGRISRTMATLETGQDPPYVATS